MGQAPESYRDVKRPSLKDAIALEGGTLETAMMALTRKGYFEPPARPWKLGVMERGLGRANFAVLSQHDDVLVETGGDRILADFIIAAVNAYKVPSQSWPPIPSGTFVRTIQKKTSDGEWTPEARAARKWGVDGEVLIHHDSHGLCYEVRHKDGTVGCYDPSELEVV